jgi:tetratricopeptide (TPR) repeat protein
VTSSVQEKVTAYEGTLTLPTYPILGENRNPVFHSQYGVAHIYPYTLLVDIATAPVEKTYRTLHLENRYLKVTVLPDLGGRVYSVYDKVSGREVFYKNSVIKFAPLAIRGAFFSGGVEFSFPVAHAPTTADPVNWHMHQHEDGSASISIGGLEHMSRMRWTITLTLYPDRCALAQDVFLQNPALVAGRYHYWTNASLVSEPQTEFIYPLRRVRSYEFAGTASWPRARLDLIKHGPGLPGMEGVPMWPADRLHDPVNFRWEKDMLAQVSIFGRNVQWDFFGAWQHSANCGYAHFADHRNVSGMKLWSWGQSPVGIVNQTALTDDGSVYAETQCGALETQLDFDFLPPGKVRQWREWWLPLRGLGGLTCASDQLGARIHLAPGRQTGQSGSIDLTVGICPVRPLRQARVRLSVPGDTLLEETVAASPEEPWLSTRTIRASQLAGHAITLIVSDENGQVLLNYVHDRQAEQVEAAEPVPAKGPITAADFYRLGLRHENFDNREQALDAYTQALAQEPQHGPAHLRLGLMHLRSADLDRAAQHLREAAASGHMEANYYLGLVAFYREQFELAETGFQAVPQESPLAAAALCGLGRIALRRGDWSKAALLFEKARALDEASTMPPILLAVALSRAGKTEQAVRTLEELLARDPLNHLALRELALLKGDTFWDRLARLLADDRQYILDLACSYLNAGLLGDALLILADTAPRWDYPMVSYLTWDILQKLGRTDEARPWLEKAAQSNPDLVFPSRVEEVLALRRVLAHSPADHKAKYYLGNFLYAHERFDEAIALWEAAAAGLDSFDVLHRNLGLAYWQRRSEPERAIQSFEKALAINPDNQDLYLYLDRLYKDRGLSQKRAALIERIEKLPALRDDLHKRLVVMLVELGQFEHAIRRLAEDKFVPTEMDQSFHLAYVAAHMQRAAARMETGQIEQAIVDYRKALEFPENVGVGRPLTSGNAEILYRLGLACEQLGRFDEAIAAWHEASQEHHSHGSPLFPFVQMSLDKLNRYSELGYD